MFGLKLKEKDLYLTSMGGETSSDAMKAFRMDSLETGSEMMAKLVKTKLLAEDCWEVVELNIPTATVETAPEVVEVVEDPELEDEDDELDETASAE